MSEAWGGKPAPGPDQPPIHVRLITFNTHHGVGGDERHDLPRLAKVLAAALSRAGEHAADRHAAELGYGPGLVQVLALYLRAEQSVPRPRGMAALLRSHPSSRSRIDALNQTLHPRVSKIYR